MIGYILGMTNDEMVTKVNEMHRKQPGYNFDASIAAAIIAAGTIPEGTVLTTRADQIAKYEADSINVYVAGNLTKSVKAEGPVLEGARMQYAYNASKLGSSIGRM